MTARLVLVTGATGTLGREVVRVLGARDGVRSRLVTRRELPASSPTNGEWARCDLARDALEPVVAGVDSVIHLASSKGDGDEDVVATTRLLDAARTAKVRHVVVISIIGCDRIPLPFYASKERIEAVTRASGVPWSVVRVAQFHSFVERLVATSAALPIPTPLVGDVGFQSVDEGEVATELVRTALGDALGDAPELAGPERISLGEAAAIWFARTGAPAKLVRTTVANLNFDDAAPWARAVLEGYRDGLNSPRGRGVLGRVTFAEWLKRRRA